MFVARSFAGSVSSVDAISMSTLGLASTQWFAWMYGAALTVGLRHF